MKTSNVVWWVVAIILAVGAWYFLANWQGQAMSDKTTDTGVMQKPMEDGAEGMIIGANVALGTDGNTTTGIYLIGYTGMPVYTKDGDSATASSCYSDCAKNWPPYLVGAEDNVNQLKAGVNGKADTFVRTDGTIQMTYNGKPLYFYAADSASSGPSGNGVGGVWHVAKP